MSDTPSPEMGLRPDMQPSGLEAFPRPQLPSSLRHSGTGTMRSLYSSVSFTSSPTDFFTHPWDAMDAALDYDIEDGADLGEDDETNCLPELELALQQAVDNGKMSSQIYSPATQEPYYKRHQLAAPIIFHAAELCAEDRENETHMRNFSDLLDAIDVEAINTYVATYDYHGQQLIHLMHFAASLGSVTLMQKILSKFGKEVVNERSRIIYGDGRMPTPMVTKVLRNVGKRAEGCCGSFENSEAQIPLLLPSPSRKGVEAKDLSENWKNVDGKKNARNYTPLLAATYMSKTDAVIWLVENGADVQASNDNCFTVLHILAQNGLPYESPYKAEQSLILIVERLLAARANLDAKTNTKNPNKSLRGRTPLEIACNKSFGYPKHMLHLLMQSYQQLDRAKPFEEVWNITQINPKAAELLTQNMKHSKSVKWRQKILNRLLREIHQVPDNFTSMRHGKTDDIQTYVTPASPVTPEEKSAGTETRESTDTGYSLDKEGRFVDMLCDILKGAPDAAADILDCLTLEPKVQDRQKNPLPNFAKLHNHIMEASWQSDVSERRSAQGFHPPSWNFRKEGIPWQSQFKSELPANPFLHADIYPVKVRTVLFPNWLKVRTLHVLALLGEHSDQMEIFGRLPVQAAITCIWRQTVRYTHIFNMVWEITLIAALLCLGCSSNMDEFVFLWNACVSMCIGTVLKELCFIAWEMSTYQMKTRWPTRLGALQTYILNFGLIQHVAPWALLWLSFGLREKDGDPVAHFHAGMKVLLAVNIFWRCCKFLLMTRVFRGMGEIILAVLLSFIPLKYMLVLIGLMFFVFWAVFVTLNEGYFSAEMVLRNLYIALFFGEGDGIENISGFGDDWDEGVDAWLKYGSVFFMAMGGVIFSVCLLNLIIAMYSSYYEEMVPMANLYFHRSRAHAMVRVLLQPGLPRCIIPRWPHYRIQILLAAVSTCSFLLFLVLLLSGLVVLSAIALAFSGWVGQASLRQQYRKEGPEEASKHYLWVCARDDYNELVNQPRVKVLNSVHQAVESLQKDVAMISYNMRDMSAKLELSMKMLGVTPQPASSRSVSVEAAGLKRKGSDWGGAM